MGETEKREPQKGETEKSLKIISEKKKFEERT